MIVILSGSGLKTTLMNFTPNHFKDNLSQICQRRTDFLLSDCF